MWQSIGDCACLVASSACSSVKFGSGSYEVWRDLECGQCKTSTTNTFWDCVCVSQIDRRPSLCHAKQTRMSRHETHTIHAVMVMMCPMARIREACFHVTCNEAVETVLLSWHYKETTRAKHCLNMEPQTWLSFRCCLCLVLEMTTSYPPRVQ